MGITETESIFCQSLAMTSLLTALNDDFLDSDYYNNLPSSRFSDDFKDILNNSGLGNPATMQMFLYALLVMPKELLEKTDNAYLDQCASDTNSLISQLIDKSDLSKDVYTTYPYETGDNLKSIDYYRHIRNTVSHSRCTYKILNGISCVTFMDTNSSGKHICEFTMKTYDVGKVLTTLQAQLIEFLKKKLLGRRS